MFRLDGRVALVTGASRGIGRATAKALAGQGAEVWVNYVRGEPEAKALVQEIEAGGGKAQLLGFDVADSSQVDAALAQLVKQTGRLDILVANAGIAIDGLLLRLKDEEFEKMMTINTRGALACARAAIKTMMRARFGRVVFVSSVIGEVGNVGQVAYAASKAALLGIAKSLAREYASRGITVNAVAPGLVETDMTQRLDEAQRTAVLGRIPLGRLGKAEEVAASIAFLCSEEAGYITGHTLRVNGGMHV